MLLFEWYKPKLRGLSAVVLLHSHIQGACHLVLPVISSVRKMD